MIGILWLLVVKAYSFMTAAIPNEQEVIEEPTGCQTEEKKETVKRKLTKKQKRLDLEILQPHQSHRQAFYQQCIHKNSSMDLELKYLSIHNSEALANSFVSCLEPASHSHKRSPVPINKPLTKPVSGKPLGLVVTNRFCNQKRQHKNMKLSTIEITLIPNKISCDRYKEITIFEGLKYVKSVEITELNENTSIVLKKQNTCTALVQYKNNGVISRNTSNHLILNNRQLLHLQQRAQYIISLLTVYGETQMLINVDDDPTGAINDNNLTNINETQPTAIEFQGNNTFSNISIIELDTTEENITTKTQTEIMNSRQDVPEIIKPMKKRKQKQKNMTVKSGNEKTMFSSKQCLGRLAYFMSADRGYTKSKLLLEIERELKPIKDQINELRKSMTEFSMINCRYNSRGVKSSILTVQPLYNKSKSIFTVPSMCTQRLSRTSMENCYPEIDVVPNKLSPMAEMYIQLSRL